MLIHTFNHSRYIRESVEGALNQVCSFGFEVIVGDDCSEDGSREILEEMAKSHGEQIRLLPGDVKLGGPANFRRTLDACRGQYIAIVDGDDYWTDRRKLQKQVMALEANPTWSGCFHRCEVFDESVGRSVGTIPESYERSLCEVEDLIVSNQIATLSIVFRKELLCRPDWIDALSLGDWPMWILLSIKGPIGFLNETMGVYRVHSLGVWSQRAISVQLHNVLQVYDALESHCPEIPTAMLREGRSQCIAKLASYARCIEERTVLLQRENQAYIRSATWRAGRVVLAPFFAFRGLLRAFVAPQVRNRLKADAAADHL